MSSEPLIRNISDTARWVAAYRARETERSDAVFKDPFAKALAGERGERIASALPYSDQNSWPFVTRTVLFDRAIAREISGKADVVLNIAAGHDARPYRMQLPPGLLWIEVDLPEILEYKETVLAGAKPACTLERMPLDLSNHDARRGLFADVAKRGSRVLVVAEGLLIYLMPAEVGALASDLLAQPSISRWLVDIASPGLLKMLDEQMGDMVRQAGAPYLFAPGEGADFFVPFGWRAVEVRSLLKAAGKLGRLPVFLRLVSMLPEQTKPQGSRPWSAVCLLSRA